MLTGLSIRPPKKRPVVSGPKLLPKKRAIARNVYLAPEMWAELDEAADFHGAVFEAMGADEKVSRNDVIDAFLRWALDAYWEDKGGRPGSANELQAKAKRHADALKKAGTTK